MTLRDFFLLGLNKGLGKKRHWMNTLFSIIHNPTDKYLYDYQLYLDDDVLYFIDPETQSRVVIDDYIPGRAPLHFRDEFILAPGELLNYKGSEPLRTTYGNVFVNHLCLVEPFGDLFEFKAGYFKPTDIEDEILNRLIDDREDGDTTTMAPDGKLHVWQYLMFADHTLALTAYADGLVTSVTERSMTGHPDRHKIRARLMEENKDRLDDPAVIAKIGNALKDLDVEYMKDDEAFEFYDAKHNKLFGAVRKKTFYNFGGESPFSDGTTVEYIHKSLEEGIDTNHMVAMNNSLRFGSYNRGAQTALGGESTKTIYRMVGTVRIIEPDCNTHIGIPRPIHQFQAKEFLGYSYVENGKSTVITETNLPGLIGKVLEIRGPMTCKSGRDVVQGVLGKGKNICAVCAGQALAENPNGIPAAAAGVGGKFLSLFLAKMHGSVLRTVRWDMTERLS